MTAVPDVEVNGASFSYDSIPALVDVTVTVSAGASVALLGTNGSGKSTLLKAFIGLLEPVSGEVRVLGVTPRQARPRIGYLRQQPWGERVAPMTVRDAVRVGRYARLGWFGRYTAGDTRAVEEAMDLLGIAGLAGRSLHELSGGQRQRVQLAQVFAQEAELLLLDEPFTGLDLPTQQQLLTILDQQHHQQRTIMVATHELAVAHRCDLVILLRGRVIAAAPPARACTRANLTTAFGLAASAAPETIEGLLLDDHHHDLSQTRALRPPFAARRPRPRN